MSNSNFENVMNGTSNNDDDGNESEAMGVSFLQTAFGADTVWKQTSYNRNFRKNYAQIGGTYDADKDAFIHMKPFASWQLNDETCQWEPPVARPDDHETNPHRWDEENQEWVALFPVGDEPDLGEKP